MSVCSYDAAYLEIAVREGLPLATLDKNLLKAAKKADIPIYLKD
ncbi:MAG: type II toxin-antitoxin system VapC family toxin [Thiotrichaceae bacterium]|nr:type II toxin-antitoxin system VapC family toxin [Thiotrichaceae bacterium]